MMAAKPSQTNLKNRNMVTKTTRPAKDKAVPKTEPKITAIKKAEIHENKHHDLIEVANGRLKDEGGLGASFEERAITFRGETRKADRDKEIERLHLDDFARKLSKAEYDEWMAADVASRMRPKRPCDWFPKPRRQPRPKVNPRSAPAPPSPDMPRKKGAG